LLAFSLISWFTGWLSKSLNPTEVNWFFRDSLTRLKGGTT
jgi:hypothetical protein